MIKLFTGIAVSVVIIILTLVFWIAHLEEQIGEMRVEMRKLESRVSITESLTELLK